ncbi:branched-chain amino acid ABC transporter permease [Mesorhizobium sp. YM1C-6-2]|uniref:branched-chain amino acid ABC transporter permease n=1 Tax=Mesorhizobium sp. YM1C-6-2 TaxID=1827501 RepID=UPI000EF222F8|nr:branched-chain amino acid ABC transporter permease [Mesorhizobium sp. YM1C-6-2]RLP28412.1 branched-chain amino acid ABC transporter permease [Mesorhizobium sp. YM1C-6-2]
MMNNPASDTAVSPHQSRALPIALATAALLVLPWLVTNDYYLRIIVLSGFYIVLAVSLNITTGFTGLLSVGHAAFFGIGAYITALLTVGAEWSFWPAFLLSAAASAAVGAALGFVSIRLRGDYLAIATICFAEVLRLLALNWISVTRGPMGVPGIPAPRLFGVSLDSQQAFYYLIGVAVVLVIYTAHVIQASPFGRALFALRDNEMAAEAMGIDTRLYKVAAFTTGAMFAGLAGSLYAPWLTFISPDNFSYLESVMILCMLIVGGLGNIWGVAFGAVLLTFSLEILRPFETFRMAIYGALLVALMIYRPQGLFGNLGWKALRQNIGSRFGKGRGPAREPTP